MNVKKDESHALGFYGAHCFVVSFASSLLTRTVHDCERLLFIGHVTHLHISILDPFSRQRDVTLCTYCSRRVMTAFKHINMI